MVQLNDVDIVLKQQQPRLLDRSFGFVFVGAIGQRQNLSQPLQ